MKEVSPTKLDALISKNIHLGRCRCGEGGGNVIILMTWGKSGVRVECPHCGRKTKLHSIRTYLQSTEGETATPVLEKSLMNGVRHAITDWNEMRYDYGGN